MSGEFPFSRRANRVSVAPDRAKESERSSGSHCKSTSGGVVAVATRGTSSNYLQRAPSPSGLAEVLDVILDKGLVIDAYVRVSVIGIEVLTIDARIVIASVDTYLHFAEAVNRLDLTQTETAGLAELRGDGKKQEAKGAMEGVKEKLPGGGDREKERSR
jgi:hypothetical protein